MLTLSQYTEMVNDAINAMQPAEIDGLYAPARYALQAGGKRLRPMLTLLVAEAFGANPSCAIPAALAVEMYHNSTLVHDDIMDNSPTRRGRDAVWHKYGLSQAILSGDAMITLSLKLIDDAPYSPETKGRLLSSLIKAQIEVDEGQQLDMAFENAEGITLNDYLKMVGLKTAVLLSTAASMGAIVANCDSEVVEKIYRFTFCLGLAFQIQDDWLDTFSDETTLGKPIGGDIVNGKRTWLLLTAMQHDEDSVNHLLNSDLTPTEKIVAFKSLYIKFGVDKACTLEVEKLTTEALDILEQLPLSELGKIRLQEFARSLVGRNY